MCSDFEHKILDRLDTIINGTTNIDHTYQLSASSPYILDYKERKYVYVWTTSYLTLSLEELGTFPVPAGSWMNLSLTPGMRIFATNQTNLVPIFVRCTDTAIENQAGTGSTIISSEYVEESGYIALVLPPTQTNAGTETILTFAQQVNHVTIENHTAANINYSFDETCTAGSLLLPPTYQHDKAKQVNTVHILTTAAQNINGSTAGNIVVRGAL